MTAIINPSFPETPEPTEVLKPPLPRAGVSSVPGIRGVQYGYQHDRYVCDISAQGSVFAVFDGHGERKTGDIVSELCKHRFLPLLRAQPEWNASVSSEPRNGHDAPLIAAFHRVVAAMESETETVTDKRRVFSGTTLNAVIIREGYLYCINVGDSRSVLAVHTGEKSGRNAARFSPVQLSVDHTCSHPAEIARIVAAGGTVKNNRLNGDLEMSRTIGDLEFKKYRMSPFVNPNGKLYTNTLLISTPDITARRLTDADGFVVVATDGLWIDTVQNETVVFCAEMSLSHGRSPEDTAKGLVELAAANGSTDNITVLVVLLNDVPQREGKVSRQDRRRQRSAMGQTLPAPTSGHAPSRRKFSEMAVPTNRSLFGRRSRNADVGLMSESVNASTVKPSGSDTGRLRLLRRRKKNVHMEDRTVYNQHIFPGVEETDDGT